MRRALALSIFFIFAAEGGARAQSEDAVARAQAQFAREPPVSEVVEVALRYFRVHPEVLDSLRSKAHSRALLPLLAAGLRFDDQRFARFEQQEPDPPLLIDENTEMLNTSVSVGAVWDLGKLVFNPSEVQVFGLIGVQRDIMLEATRTYYLRKQLVLRKLYKPPQDPMAKAALDMRIDEFTALLDVLTGGWFSEQSAAGG
jgi:hypothetical protein